MGTNTQLSFLPCHVDGTLASGNVLSTNIPRQKYLTVLCLGSAVRKFFSVLSSNVSYIDDKIFLSKLNWQLERAILTYITYFHLNSGGNATWSLLQFQILNFIQPTDIIFIKKWPFTNLMTWIILNLSYYICLSGSFLKFGFLSGIHVDRKGTGK